MICQTLFSGDNTKKLSSFCRLLKLPESNTDNSIYADTRYNDKTRYNDNLTVTKPSLKR